MCKVNCFCLVCELENTNRRGIITLENSDRDELTREELRDLDLFDEFVKAGLGS